MFELQDSKSTQSLAQIYEGEYTAAKAGGLQLDDRDGKLQREHEELEKIWEGITGKLDALCNAHFTPKAVRCHLFSNVPVWIPDIFAAERDDHKSFESPLHFP